MGNSLSNLPIHEWFLDSNLFKFYKYILFFIFQKCELQRLLEKSDSTNFNVCKCIIRSRVLKNEASLITKTINKTFDPLLISKGIIKKKNFNKDTIFIQNKLNLIYNKILAINLFIDKTINLKNIPFDKNNHDHRSMIDQFWNNMQPSIRREGSQFESNSWKELGFQGKDPSTDFRGMGIYSLINLVEMSKSYSIQSRKLLLESNNPKRYFPYAAVGINITGVIIKLIETRSLHHILLEIDQNDFDNQINQTYAQLYLAFGDLWVARDPIDRGIMAFPEIFGEFTTKIYLEHKIL